MSRYFIGCAMAGAFALSTAVAAQYPPASTPSTAKTPVQDPAKQDRSASAVVEGCLMREADVPGRKPNVAERAGVGEDYILTQAKVVKGTAPAAGAPRPGETATGTSGMKGQLFDITGINDDELKKHAGKRVRVEGTFANVDRPAEAGKQRPVDDLVQIRGTSVRAVSGECAAK